MIQCHILTWLQNGPPTDSVVCMNNRDRSHATLSYDEVKKDTEGKGCLSRKVS